MIHLSLGLFEREAVELRLDGAIHPRLREYGATAPRGPMPRVKDRRQEREKLATQLAEEDRAPITELGHEGTELVTGIRERDRCGAIGHGIAREQLCALGRSQLVGIDTEHLGKGATIYYPVQTEGAISQPTAYMIAVQKIVAELFDAWGAA